MYGYIYLATRQSDGKIYVGQHHGEFNPKYHGKGTHVRNTPAKDFDVIMLAETFNVDDARKKERYYIELYESRNPEIGLNIKRGGGGGTLRVPSIEERQKQSLMMTLNNPSKNKDMSGKNNPHYGHPTKHSKETKELISRKNSGMHCYNDGVSNRRFKSDTEAIANGYPFKGRIKTKK